MIMSKNVDEQQHTQTNAAEPRAAVTNGEGSPDPVFSDTAPYNTSLDAARPKGGSGVARNIVLFEGPADDVHQAVAELQLEFPAATVEAPAETARHRGLFQKETDALPATVPADAIARAVRFETAPPRTPDSIPDAMVAVKTIIDRWRNTLTTGHVYFDTRLVASVVAVVYCGGPNSNDASRALIGSLGGRRQAYFRLKRHFYLDDSTFFRDVVTEAGEAQIRYPYRQEWSEDDSPLRLQFMSEDPARDGWGLAPGALPRRFPRKGRCFTPRRRFSQQSHQLDDGAHPPGLRHEHRRLCPFRRRRPADDLRVRTPCSRPD